MTKLIPLEIYLLETFSSLDYFSELRDTWGAMIKHLESCLEKYMLNLPADYRNKPLPEQPDVVWGERVLPNFRQTFQSLCSGYISLSHGDSNALLSANGPLNDQKGQRDYSTGWMTKAEVERYFKLLSLASGMATNICATAEPYWLPGDIVDHLQERGPLKIPAILPGYRLDSSVTVCTDEPVKQAGIYLPNLEASCAQFLALNSDAPPAPVLQRIKDLLYFETGIKYGEEPVFEDKPCVWTLVERAKTSNQLSVPESLLESAQHRTPAGDACTAAGYYFSPAEEGSRRRFEVGDVMPHLKSNYGATIWQWDRDQS